MSSNRTSTSNGTSDGTKGNGKPLRFAALARVSTERQERKGESLRTQRAQLQQAADTRGDTITRWYVGQEHATEGSERRLLDDLLAEAVSPDRAFDAVMVPDPSRWSRDNVKSETGLETLRGAGVKFFVLTTEYDLFEPQARLFLGMSSVIGAFHAGVQSQKSLLNRIALAERGIPPVGKRPFGRDYDKKTGQWSIIPAKHDMIRDVAERCLAGEPMKKVAASYGVHYPHLCKILREDCGDQWTLNFCSPRRNIDKDVVITVPRLLDDATIRACTDRLTANRTRLNGQPKYDYLLNGYIFCAECRFLMTGQVGSSGVLYYRHATHPKAKECPALDERGFRPCVRAKEIDQAVLGDLFDMFGNPAAIERAVRAAVRDCDKLEARQGKLQGELDKIGKRVANLVDAVAEGTLTKEDVREKRQELDERAAQLRQELATVEQGLQGIRNLNQQKQCWVEQSGTSIFVYDNVADGGFVEGGNDLGTWLALWQDDRREDRRAIIEAHFSGLLPDGKPSGVYILGPKPYTYELRGQLVWLARPKKLVPWPRVKPIASQRTAASASP
jgi:DNA invertase Pin-like site-specific DNA recombinase